MHIQSSLSLHCSVSITMSSGFTHGDNSWTVNALNVILFSGSAPGSLRTMVLKLSKERDEIYVDANEGFFYCFSFFGLRGTQRTSTGVQPPVPKH